MDKYIIEVEAEEGANIYSTLIAYAQEIAKAPGVNGTTLQPRVDYLSDADKTELAHMN